MTKSLGKRAFSDSLLEMAEEEKAHLKALGRLMEQRHEERAN